MGSSRTTRLGVSVLLSMALIAGLTSAALGASSASPTQLVREGADAGGVVPATTYTISGTLTGTGGSPVLSGVTVYAYAGINGYTASTHADGTYSLAVPGGSSYIVQFFEGSVYLNGWYDSNVSGSHFTTILALSTPVAVSSNVTGIDVQLGSGVHIGGTVTNTAGAALAGIVVVAHSPAGYQGVATTAANGTYSVLVPLNDSFIVSFSDNSVTYDSGYYDPAVPYSHLTPEYGSATPVPVVASDVSLLTVAMAKPWSISLGASATSVTVGTSVTLTATVNQALDYSPYYCLIEASDNSVLVSYGHGTTCSTTVSSSTLTSRAYHAVVAYSDGTSLVVTSNTVTVTWTPDHLVLAPATATITVGGSQSYTAEGFDSSNISLGNVTSATTFTIAGGGSCVAASCISTVPGDHIVTGTNGTATGTATLHVTPIITGDTYVPITPVRLLDTRSGNGLSGKLSANTPATFQISGRGGIPAGATAVTGNVTVVNSSNAWAVYLGPDPIASPTTSTINFATAEITANGLTVALSATGSLSATYMSTAGNTTDLVFDVTGYFTAASTGATYHPMSPARLLDTRFGNGLSTHLLANTPATFQVSGRGGVPAGATAVTGNVTVVNSTNAWAIALVPVPTASPTTSTLNFVTGQIKANNLTVALGAGGTLSATYMSTAGNTTDLVFDVTGFYTADLSGAAFVPLTPARLLDTRYGNGLSGKISANTPATFTVSGRGGVPANAVGVSGNVTVVNETNAWAIYLGPDPIASPTTSTLNFVTGDIKANGLTVALGAGGTLSATYMSTAGNTTDLVFDVTGYFVPAGG